MQAIHVHAILKIEISDDVDPLLRIILFEALADRDRIGCEVTNVSVTSSRMINSALQQLQRSGAVTVTMVPPIASPATPNLDESAVSGIDQPLLAELADIDVEPDAPFDNEPDDDDVYLTRDNFYALLAALNLNDYRGHISGAIDVVASHISDVGHWHSGAQYVNVSLLRRVVDNPRFDDRFTDYESGTAARLTALKQFLVARDQLAIQIGFNADGVQHGVTESDREMPDRRIRPIFKADFVTAAKAHGIDARVAGRLWYAVLQFFSSPTSLPSKDSAVGDSDEAGRYIVSLFYLMKIDSDSEWNDEFGSSGNIGSTMKRSLHSIVMTLASELKLALSPHQATMWAVLLSAKR